MLRCEEPEAQKSMHFMESEPEAFARYLLDRGIADTMKGIDDLNEELRQAAVAKKGKAPEWDEYHSLAIRNIFELKRVARALIRMRDGVNSYYGDFTEATYEQQALSI